MTGSLARPLTPVLVALVALVLLVLQSSSRVPADLVFLLTLAVASRWGAWPATGLGWWGGLAMGALRGSLALPMAFLYGLVGFLAGAYRETSEREGLLETASLIAALSLLIAAGEALLLLLTGLTLETARAEVLPQLLASVALGAPLMLMIPLKR